MVQKYIIDKTDLPKLIQGEELALTQGSKYRAFCIEINGKLTNGDVIKALFPDCIFSHGNSCSYLKFKGNLFTMAVEDAWWNEPYKGVENES